MKKILLSLFVLALVGITFKAHSQCTVSNLAVEVLSFNNSTCQVTFNLSFEQEVNNGNKFAYIHLWRDAAYHTPAANWPSGGSAMYTNPSRYPVKADLLNALATIVIENNGTPTPTIGTVYYPDPAPTGITPVSAGLSITKTILPGGVRERETISGLSLTLAGCSGVVRLKGDIWASQAANGKNVHCPFEGLTFNINDPQITSAFKVCNPRSITFGIKNNGTSSLTEHFVLYKDDGDGIFEPFSGQDGPAIFTGADTTLSPGASQSRVKFSYPGAITPNENASLWLEVVVPATSFTTVAYISNNDAQCKSLPVEFKSFVASRNHSNVSLKWETASEQNNSGFAIERKIGDGTWHQIAFISSLAVGGNSSTDLKYAYNDLNETKGISQYRIKQIDIDNKFKYSEVRAVRGDGQLGKTIVFPNPSNDGNVTIVFEDANVTRDISLVDMNGRTIKQIKSITNNTIQLDKLIPGIYSLRIVVRESGDQAIERIVVIK